jgi:hypothetical protein
VLTLPRYAINTLENKEHFKTVLENFIKEYGFNPELFPDSTTTEKLQSTEPLFMVVSDKAYQLSEESGEDARPITDSVQLWPIKHRRT